MREGYLRKQKINTKKLYVYKHGVTSGDNVKSVTESIYTWECKLV